jgi:type I restriction enzyme S subunit
MKLRPYTAYKESGLPWLGRVPKHWELLRAKYLMREMDTRSKDESGTLLSVSQYAGVTKRRPREGSEDPDTRSSSLVGYKVAKPGNLVSNIMLAWNGSLGIAPMDGVVSPAYCVYRICIGEPWFFHHLLRSPAYKAEIKRRSRGVVESRLRLYTDDFFRIPILLPNVKEQQAIVRFVPDLDSKVRRFIRNRRRLIEVLNEQKQAIINRAVTRGLNPEAHLKPSGIDWLGDIPAHWEFNKGKFYFREVNQRSSTGKEELLSVSHITGVTPRSQKNIYMFKAGSYVGYKLVMPEQIAVNTMWAWMAAIGVSQYHGIISSSYHTYEQIKKFTFNTEYLDLLLRSMTYKYLYLLNSKGITSSRLRLYPEGFLNLKFLKPPKDEQQHIVNWLKNATASLGAAITRNYKEIDLIREYRTRLISDVVTGKMDVRHLAPSPGSEDLEETVEALEPLEEDIAADMMNDEDPVNEAD